MRRQFERKLAERLVNPRVPSAALKGFPNCYKIKLKSAGYRLIYRVEDDALVILIVRIGQREGGEVYVGPAARLAGRP